ncbi:uncharacterized protein LOC131075934 isoform X2 [Cryptomeria japonica]|nr:uncharacterized protein LOC131075934 isoform X2 [Cryptomeria japonica]
MEENDDEDTQPFEDTVPLESTVALEDTAVLENVALLETQLVDDDKNQEERLLPPRERGRDAGADNAVNVVNIQGDTEAKTQLLEDFQLDNGISSLRNQTHMYTVVDSDDENGGETVLLSEDDDASDGRSSPQRVDELKLNQFPVEAAPLPTTRHVKETSLTHSRDMGKGFSFNTVISHHELEQKPLVDSDALTEDECDLGILPQKSSQNNKKLDGSRALLQECEPDSKNDSHISTSHLLSDDLNNLDAIQSVCTGRQVKTDSAPAHITRGNSHDLSSASTPRCRNIASTPRCRNIASIRAASLRASGLRASEMLSKTKEITGAQGAKNECDGKYDSHSLSILGMSKPVQVMKSDPAFPSSPKFRTESLRARRLFPDTESIEVNEMKARDEFELRDNTKARNNNKEDNAPRAIHSNNDEQMTMFGNKEDDKPRAEIVVKEDDGSSGSFENEKDDILRKGASNAVDSQQLKSRGLQELGHGKKTPSYSISAGLSYADSQEPGEQSQADALNMVDKLVWLNTTGFSQDPAPPKLLAMTYSGPSSANGPQNLAQLVESKGPTENIGVFDWVDSQNYEAGRQCFGKNSQGVLASTNKADKLKTESKQRGCRYHKSKHESSVPDAKAENIGKNKSKILLQALQKVASSGASEANLSTASNSACRIQNKFDVAKDREANVTVFNGNKLQFASDTLRFSKRLRSVKEQNHDKNKTDAPDEKELVVEKLPLNSGEACDQQVKKSLTCRDSLDLSNIGNDTQLAAEAMQIMCLEIPHNQATEDTFMVAKRGCTEWGDSRKRNGRGLHKASERHNSRKRTLSDTDHGTCENYANQKRTSRNSVATLEESSRVQWAEDEEKLQNKDEGRKSERLRKSKQAGKEKLESNNNPAYSEAWKENNDTVEDSLKVPKRKRSNMEEAIKPAEEIQLVGAGARVGCFTRQKLKLNQGDLCETETNSKSSGADQKGNILEDSAKVIKRKRKLATDLTEPARVQSVRKAKGGMQLIAGSAAICSTRQINKKIVEKQKPETQIHRTIEEDKDMLNNVAKVVISKRKHADVEEISYKQIFSPGTQLLKSQPSKDEMSTSANTEETCLRAGDVAVTSSSQAKSLLQEENLKLDKQSVSKSSDTHGENRDTSMDLSKSVRRKRSKTNKEERKLNKSISTGEGLHVDTADRDLRQKVGESTAVCTTRQSVRNLGLAIGLPISPFTAIDGDKSDHNNMVAESSAQGQKSRGRKTVLTAPSDSKLANHGTSAYPNKDEVQLNDASVDVRSPFPCQTENINFKSPAITGFGQKATRSSCKVLLTKGTPKSTLKRELGQLVSPESGQSLILKDSVRKRREPSSIRVLFSHSLDDDIEKQQKKILAKLGGQLASSAADCTHFVTDKFVRTRNMLEAIAAGKSVITHLWLENCGQASYFIDEKKYILRDEKKEKEIGFSMTASLAVAQQNPLLQGKRVFVTPSTKPEQESIISMVKAANGQVLNGLKGALSKEETMESVIVISCEEDYKVCIPLLEKGARIYSPEFLLNGIVVQRLDFFRDRLFTDSVKRPRSTKMHSRQRT